MRAGVVLSRNAPTQFTSQRRGSQAAGDDNCHSGRKNSADLALCRVALKQMHTFRIHKSPRTRPVRSAAQTQPGLFYIMRIFIFCYCHLPKKGENVLFSSFFALRGVFAGVSTDRVPLNGVAPPLPRTFTQLSTLYTPHSI
jgi:hypothetical protein